MAPMYLGFLGVIDDGHDYAILIGPYVVVVALLLVSRIPTFSGKNMGTWIPRETVLPVLGLAVFAAIMLIAYPWESLTVVALAYLLMIPVSIRSYRQHKAADLARETAGK